METTLQALKWRYATKQFDPAKKIPASDLKDLLEVLRLSPSSYGLQPWKFVVVTDKALREKLKPHAWNQPQITDASHLIIIYARKTLDSDYVRKFITETAKSRNVTVESLAQYEQMILGSTQRSPEAIVSWNQKQAYIALGFLMEACAIKGIDTCPMEGFVPDEFDKLLPVEGYTATVVCPVGYRSPSDKYASIPKMRFSEHDVIIHK